MGFSMPTINPSAVNPYGTTQPQQQKQRGSFGSVLGAAAASLKPPIQNNHWGNSGFSAAPAVAKAAVNSFRGGQTATTPTNPYGTESGPGLLEQYAQQRATGTDPGYQYAMKRGMDDIDSRMAAGGSYNSGARGMQLSDFAANMGAQREGQLDALMSGASGERAATRANMTGLGMGLAGGEAGTMGVYDTSAANSLNTANQAILSMFLNKAGVDQQSNQQGLGNLLKLGALL